MSATGTTVDELGRRRLARAAATTHAAEFTRHGREDWPSWLAHLGGAAAGCSHPIRLAGSMTTVEQATGRITAETSTTDLPDAVLYAPCGNRRAHVCPSCAEIYGADTYHLVTNGLLARPPPLERARAALRRPRHLVRGVVRRLGVGRHVRREHGGLDR